MTNSERILSELIWELEQNRQAIISELTKAYDRGEDIQYYQGALSQVNVDLYKVEITRGLIVEAERKEENG